MQSINERIDSYKLTLASLSDSIEVCEAIIALGPKDANLEDNDNNEKNNNFKNKNKNKNLKEWSLQSINERIDNYKLTLASLSDSIEVCEAIIALGPIVAKQEDINNTNHSIDSINNTIIQDKEVQTEIHTINNTTVITNKETINSTNITINITGATTNNTSTAATNSIVIIDTVTEERKNIIIKDVEKEHSLFCVFLCTHKYNLITLLHTCQLFILYGYQQIYFFL